MSPKNLITKRCILFLFLLTINSLAFSQGLKVTVLDAVNGEPLVGATVILNNQSNYIKLDGSFTFKNTVVGKNTIKVSYTGYKTETKEFQINKLNEVKNIEILLQPTSNTLTSVSVSSSSSKDNEKSVRRLEKIADPIINVLSSKNIQLLPDITVANALQRVSGVTIEKSSSGEARYPIIRGMEKRYINTLINGIKIPSPDNKNRFIPLDLFPSELLERLEVGKSLTPNMEGDAIGGTINLVMKDAPEHLLLQANAAGGYNTSFPDQKFSQFDNATMNLQSPAQVKGNTYVATLSDFPLTHLNYTEKSKPTNSTFGLTFGKIGRAHV